jgi:hypothetical protein
MRTNLDRAIERLLQVFGALAGFSLVKFITTPMPKEPYDPLLAWSLAIALAAFLLRLVLGSAVHLNQRFVNGIDPNDPVRPNLVFLFAKDFVFLLALGLIAVGLTLSESVDKFILWATVFVGLGFVWGVVDFVTRRFLNELAGWGRPEKTWLVIDALQTSLFLAILHSPLPHPTKAAVLAAVCIPILIWDVVLLVG